MGIIESASRDALFVITILRLIPRNKMCIRDSVKGGAVSPRLCNLKVGETILLDTEMNGMLIESRLQPGGRDLWLLSTGTGVAQMCIRDRAYTFRCPPSVPSTSALRLNTAPKIPRKCSSPALARP